MAGAVALSSALVHNSTLRELNLGGCGLGNDGCMALAQALARWSPHHCPPERPLKTRRVAGRKGNARVRLVSDA